MIGELNSLRMHLSDQCGKEIQVTSPTIDAVLITLALLVTACGSPSPVPSTALISTATTEAFDVSITPSETPVTSRTSTSTLTPPAAETANPADLSDVARLSVQALDFLTTFTNDMSPRTSGTEQERTAAEFLQGLFQGLGFRTDMQEFTFETLTSFATLTAEGLDAPYVESIQMTLSAEGVSTGRLIHVDLAFEEDIPAEGLDGNVALIRRGEIMFEEKIQRVTVAGATSAIVYNNTTGLFAGTLQTDSSIPVVTTSMETGKAIVDLLKKTEIQAVVGVTVVEVQSQNVIAEIPGTDGNVVVLGGHSDTVPEVPGANDNGSGIASIVVAAQEIAKADYPFTVRIIAFGAEELGLYGSKHYVQSLTNDEKTSIIAMLNYDALASSDILGVTGDSELQDIAIRLAKDSGIELLPRLLPRNASSDHASFLAADIPAVFFMDNDFSRIHTSDDKLEFINEDLMGQSVYIGLALLHSLAIP